MIKFVNYFLTSKFKKLTEGHLNSEDLYQKILDHDGSTAYCGYFDLDENLLKLEWDTGKKDKKGKPIYEYHLSGQTPKNPDYKCNGKSFAKYEGICRPALNMVSFDFDAEDPNDSLIDVRKFLEWLDIDDAITFFSGSKGFHVMVPFGYFDLEPNEHLPIQLRDLAKHLKTFFPTLDTSIYDYARKFRVPFSEHEKSNLFKIIIDSKSNMEAIKKLSINRIKYDFETFINHNQKPLQVITDALEESKRKSYEVEKEKAGVLEKPSPFEKYDNKLCIKAMLNNRCEDVGRNNACLRIVNDFYRVGTPQSICETEVMKWASQNGLPITEATDIITNIYQRGANYNFGCQDEVKSSFCTSKCTIWKKLDPEKRPQTVDQPSGTDGSKSEMAISRKMLEEIFFCKYDGVSEDFYGGFIAKQGDKDLFIYKDKYWQYVDEALTDKLKRKINQMAGGKLSTKRIEATFKMLRIYIPTAERDLFTPRTNAAAFANGTLYLQEDANGKFYLDFRENHLPSDYLTHRFKFDYVKDTEENNEMFDDLCNRVFEDDEDKEAKINSISEMYGAALMPYFPHLFFLCGKAQSGKSTFMLILNEMLDEEDHICSVQPKDWKNFNMEPMINKLVNIVTDVNTKKPIEDDVVKQIEDRVPVSINRKGKSVVRAPLPSLHIFGGNDFMKSEDGSSKAMARRWSIIRFLNEYKGKQMRNFAHVCFNTNPQGVVNFALRGLNRLVDNQGYFTKFESSEAELKAWASESDTIEQFIEEIEVDGFQDISVGDDMWMKRTELYSAFKEWQEASGYIKELVGKKPFYKALSQKGYALRKREGYFGFVGFGTSQDVINSESCNNDSI